MPQLTVRSFVIQILALLRGFAQKTLASRVEMTPNKVSKLFQKDAKVSDQDFERVLAGLEAAPAEVAIVTGCYEALAGLENDELTPAEREEIELEVLACSRLHRQSLTGTALLTRQAPSWAGYPPPGEVEPARWLAEFLLSGLKDATESRRSTVLKLSPQIQTWACAEWAAEESVRVASRNLEEAGAWARFGVEIAELVQGPEGWRNRVKGFAAAHAANVLRAKGDLKAADAALEPAKQLWLTGSDPDLILDPGRILDLEATLRRGQRRFDEALDLLDRAQKVGRCSARTLILKGFTLEVMGEYQRAVGALLEADVLVSRQADPRLWYQQRFNLAVNYCHLERYADVARLVHQVREVATELQDQIFLNRVTWLDGRLAAGMGRTTEALRLLGKAQEGFAKLKMWYDVALALLEISALLLDQGRTAEVKALVPALGEVFRSREVHREALVALRLFQDATEHETATAELARNVLRFLFRARYDQDLRFSS